VVNQNALNILSFSQSQHVREAIDEIRVGNSFAAVIGVAGDPPDSTPPTLVSILDDRVGETMQQDEPVTYTLTFSEPMDSASIGTAAFANAGTSSIHINAVTQAVPGTVTVTVTPVTAGSLQLRVLQDAVLTDMAGNPLDTTAAIDDDTIITANPAMIDVPFVIGTPLAEAETSIAGAGLTVGFVTGQHSESVPAGAVISQSPSGGTSLGYGSSVDLLVSLGPLMMTVPGVSGLSQAAAEAAILAADLVVGTVTPQTSSTIPAGEVISQDPAAGTSVSPGTAVDLVVSLGDPAPPAIIALSPADGAGGIGVTATLSAAFDEDIIAGSGGITIRNLTDSSETRISINDVAQVSITGAVLTIHPASDLAAGRNYAVLIDAGAVRDLAGNPFDGLTDDSGWNFTTLAESSQILFADDFDAAMGTSLTTPGVRASGAVAASVGYVWTSTTEVVVDGMLNWDASGSRDAAHEQTDAPGSESMRIDHDFGPHVAGKVWEVEFDQRVSSSHPLTFGLSDDVQPGTSAAWDDGQYDFATGSYGTSLRHDADDDNGPAAVTVDGVFPNPPNLTDTHHFRIRFDEPAGTATVWINGVEKGSRATLDFENTGRYLSWGEPADYAGALDNLKVSVMEPNQAPLWVVDPLAKADAMVGSAYSATLAGAASDPDGDPLAFAKLSGPAWLDVAADGTLSGTPESGDLGPNVFSVSVGDGIAPAVTATLNLTVNPALTTVPNVVGLAQATAEAEIVAANLVVGTVTTEHNATVPVGQVISQNPGGDLSVVQGSSVDLFVSLGTFPSVSDYAHSDIPVSGTVGGTYENTLAGDDIYQTLAEMESDGEPAQTRFSHLEHRWTFNITGGEMVTFLVEAHHNINNESDDFLFSYSTSGGSGPWHDMFMVTKISDNDTLQSFVMPSGTSGEVHVRLLDTNRSAGRTALDTLYIDQMFFLTENDGQGGPSVPDEVVWAEAYDGADLGDLSADLDSDGLSNGEERIWGLDPTRGSSCNAIQTPLDTETGTFRYTRRDRALTGLTYSVWTSTDLITWAEDLTAGQVPGAPDAAGVLTEEVTLSPALRNNPSLFIQVRATE
jgi:beta-lactam-binding protein with PASTA domain